VCFGYNCQMEKQIRIQFSVRKDIFDIVKREAMKAGHYSDAGAARFACEQYVECLKEKDSQKKS
jgi:hypothetical protein